MVGADARDAEDLRDDGRVRADALRETREFVEERVEAWRGIPADYTTN